MTDEIEEAVARAMKDASRKAYGHWQPCDELEVMAKAAIAAHKSALAKAGMGIRPREPTEGMCRAATEKRRLMAEAIWKAMWDAHKPDG